LSLVNLIEHGILSIYDETLLQKCGHVVCNSSHKTVLTSCVMRYKPLLNSRFSSLWVRRQSRRKTRFSTRGKDSSVVSYPPSRETSGNSEYDCWGHINPSNKGNSDTIWDEVTHNIQRMQPQSRLLLGNISFSMCFGIVVNTGEDRGPETDSTRYVVGAMKLMTTEKVFPKADISNNE
jgi:hypothetical protein